MSLLSFPLFLGFEWGGCGADGRDSYVERYSYFGSFRSSVSNVGPNEAMLDQNGQLTDIGAWYLGGPATGNIPGAASSISRLTAWSIAMVAISTWVLW